LHCVRSIRVIFKAASHVFLRVCTTCTISAVAVELKCS
jgi:hypothetical protein